jgi:hypothetical protein
MGKLLGKIQNTEEVQTDDIADDSNNDGLNVKDMKFAESKFFSHTLGAALYIRFSPTSCAIRFPDGNDVLPSIHVDDIPSPPPDQFS